MSIKYTLVVDAATGAVTGTSADQTLTDRLVDVVTLPFGITAVEGEVIDKSTAAMATIAHASIGFFVGEAFGNSRGRSGKQSFVPLFRG